MESLWALLQELRADFPRIAPIKYNAAYENEADDAIVKRFLGSPIETWFMSEGAWRVWYERLTQMIIVAGLNEAAGNNEFMPVPIGCPESALTPAVALYFLHGLELPYPPFDQSGQKFPEDLQAVSKWLH